MPAYTCSRCNDDKPSRDFHEAKPSDRKRSVTSRCKECRREARYERLFETVCAQCLRHRALDKNKVCKKCNADSGLRQCRGPCVELLALYMEFDGRRTTCKTCRNNLRRGSSGLG